MKNSDLIKKLQAFDPDAHVAIFDHKKNMHDCDGSEEGSHAGCHGDFDVHIMDVDMIPKGTKPWVALSFDNPDIEDEGYQTTQQSEGGHGS